MKLVLALSLCLFFGFNAYAQTDKPGEAAVEEIILARSDGSGGIGEATEKFTTADRLLYFTINLDATKSVAVKMNLVAAKAAGLKPETKVVTVSYTTKDGQNQVNFNTSPNGVWAAGDYRADIFINDKLAKSQAFVIEKSAKDATPVKSFTTGKPLRRTRKN